MEKAVVKLLWKPLPSLNHLSCCPDHYFIGTSYSSQCAQGGSRPSRGLSKRTLRRARSSGSQGPVPETLRRQEW
jgi:hypothetical protein